MQNLSATLGRTAAELLAEVKDIRERNPEISRIQYDLQNAVIQGTGPGPGNNIVYAGRSAALRDIGDELFSGLGISFGSGNICYAGNADARILETLLDIVDMYEWVAAADIGFIHDLPYEIDEKKDATKKAAWIFIKDGVIKLAAVLTTASALACDWRFYESERGLIWTPSRGEFAVPVFSFGAPDGAVNDADLFLLENGVLPVRGCELQGNVNTGTCEAHIRVVMGDEVVWEKNDDTKKWRRIAAERPEPAGQAGRADNNDGNNNNASLTFQDIDGFPAFEGFAVAVRNEWSMPINAAVWDTATINGTDYKHGMPFEKHISGIAALTALSDKAITTGYGIKDERNLEFTRGAWLAGITFELALTELDQMGCRPSVMATPEAVTERMEAVLAFVQDRTRRASGMETWNKVAGFSLRTRDIVEILNGSDYKDILWDGPGKKEMTRAWLLNDSMNGNFDRSVKDGRGTIVGFRRARGVLARDPQAAPNVPDELRVELTEFVKRRIAKLRKLEKDFLQPWLQATSMQNLPGIR